jgi:hypothetical protein
MRRRQLVFDSTPTHMCVCLASVPSPCCLLAYTACGQTRNCFRVTTACSCGVRRHRRGWSLVNAEGLAVPAPGATTVLGPGLAAGSAPRLALSPLPDCAKPYTHV